MLWPSEEQATRDPSSTAMARSSGDCSTSLPISARAKDAHGGLLPMSPSVRLTSHSWVNTSSARLSTALDTVWA